MSETFPPILCRACGKHWLSRDQAKAHKHCKGIKAALRDEKCLVCGDAFYDIRIGRGKKTKGKPLKRVRRWSGREIYKHKIAHIRAGDEADE